MPLPIYIKADDKLTTVNYNDAGNASARAAMEAAWKAFNRFDPATGQTFAIWHRPTARPMQVQVDRLLPAGTAAGRYRIEVFVPNSHATSTRITFTVANNFRTENGQPAFDDTIRIVNMKEKKDEWVTLGEFDVDVNVHPWSGRVRQMDLSTEFPAAEVSFGPVRWVPLFGAAGDTPRFDSPVGTIAERDLPLTAQAPFWNGPWFDFNPFLAWYALGHHTGADLNKSGGAAADAGAPVYAIADGKVTFAGTGSGSWGKIIVLEHPDALVPLPNGETRRQPVYSRYGHVSNDMRVKTGDVVTRGQLIGHIGLMAGATSGWHLHFDISYTDLLKRLPSSWPDMRKIRQLEAEKKTKTAEYKQAQLANRQEVLAHYLDPLVFLKANHR